MYQPARFAVCGDKASPAPAHHPLQTHHHKLDRFQSSKLREQPPVNALGLDGGLDFGQSFHEGPSFASKSRHSNTDNYLETKALSVRLSLAQLGGKKRRPPRNPSRP